MVQLFCKYGQSHVLWLHLLNGSDVTRSDKFALIKELLSKSQDAYDLVSLQVGKPPLKVNEGMISLTLVNTGDVTPVVQPKQLSKKLACVV